MNCIVFENNDFDNKVDITYLKYYIFLYYKIYFIERIIIMAEGVLEIDDSVFDAEVLKSDKPVLIDFWAPWCGPCRAISPLVEQLAGEFGDKIKFVKCNVDDNPISPGKYGIRSIPTLMFFKDGNVVDQVIGIVAKSKLEEVINKIL
jgi:thioredoxin 1